MELALPHIVVWTHGTGLGADLVAALVTHPVEVSEVRGLIEAQRAAAGPPVMLVVLVCPDDIHARVAEAMLLYPRVSLLVMAENPGDVSPGLIPAETRLVSVPVTGSLEVLCWHVAEALSRQSRSPPTPQRRLGPMFIEVDRRGVVGASCELSDSWFFPGPYPRPEESLLPLFHPEDRDAFADQLERVGQRAPIFFPIRVLDTNGSSHPMHVGLNASSPERVMLILQPLIDAAPIVGHRRGIRDPFTGLIDRWELWRRMEVDDAISRSTFVLHAKLDTFAAIATEMDFHQVDELFDRVASAITQIFPWPALPSRLSGGAFLILIKDMSTRQVKALSERLIQRIGRIRGSLVRDVNPLSMSIGAARVSQSDHDLAVRLAETAAREAHAAGGNQVVFAGPQTLIRSRLGDLQASLDLESWEVWLQPVVRPTDRQPEFHEALARFGNGPAPPASRSEFFTTGQAVGLLERFDRRMIIRSLEVLVANPGLRLSVNVTRETFLQESFPEFFLRSLEEADVAVDRVILEISPACLTLPTALVHARLERLQAGQVAVALDDFGSGICSLRHLTDFSLRMVKLDGIVTGYVADDPLQRNFVRMTVNLCRARGIQTAAEYIHTDQQMGQLVADGIDLFQGDLFGMASPVTDLFRPPPTSSSSL